jgi:hypothetical protein
MYICQNTTNLNQIYYLCVMYALLEFSELEDDIYIGRNMSLFYTHEIYCLNIVAFSLIRVLYIILS